jgi:hypothetical protein
VAVTLNYVRAGVYRLSEEREMEHVSVSVALLIDVYDALVEAAENLGGDENSPGVLGARDQAWLVEQRLALVLDHALAQRRRREDPYPSRGWTEVEA